MMSQNGQDATGALLVAALPMPGGTVFERHEHHRHQLAWTDSGVLEIATDTGTWMLPPTLALWLPAGVAHRTSGVGATMLRGVYLDPAHCPVSWPRPQPLAVGPLLGALLMHLGEDLAPDARARAEAVLPDLLMPVAATAVRLALPCDDRAREVALALLADPADPRTLAGWGHEVGASARTLSRGFRDATGLTFGQWRTAARVRAALGQLAAGRPVAAVAPAVGYATASAFISAFRRQTATTPAAYFSAPRQ